MKRSLALGVILGILWPAVTIALDRQKVQYVGGNIASLTLQATGTLSTDAEDRVVFSPDKKRDAQLSVPYGAARRSTQKSCHGSFHRQNRRVQSPSPSGEVLHPPPLKGSN